MGSKVSIAKQPVEEQIVCVGKSVTLSITAEGTPDQFVWQFSRSGVEENWSDVTGERFDGANTPVLRLLDVQIPDRGFYRCLVGHKQETVVSTSSALIVVSRPVITSPPSDKCQVPIRESTTLTIEAAGISLNFQWQKKASREGANHHTTTDSGASCSEDDILAAVYPTMSESFDVRCALPYLREQNLINWDQHERLRLPNNTRLDMVNMSMPWLPRAGKGYLKKLVICLRKTSKECPVHDSIADKIEAALKKAKHTKEYVIIRSSSEGWTNLKDGGNFSGCNEACLRVSSVGASDAGVYQCRVSNDAGEVFSPPVHLLVVKAPRIVEDLKGVTVKHHDSVTLRVGVECEGSLCFEWERRENNSTEWQDVSSETRYNGQGTPSLVIADVDKEDVGMFRCRISSAGGHTVTMEAPFQIVKAPKILKELRDARIKPHETVTFEVAAECREEMTYVWHRREKMGTEWREVSLGSKYKGQGAPCLVVADVDEADVGTFRCVVSSDGGTVETRHAHLKIICAPTITGDLQDVKASLLAKGIFKVSAECEDPMTYVWRTKSANSTEWQDVSYDPKYKGQGTPTLVVAGVEEEDVGLFRCVVSSDGGTVETRHAHLKIIDAPKIVEDVPDMRVKPRSQVTLKVCAVCEEPMNYVWKTKRANSTEWQELSSGSKYRGQGTPSLVIANVAERDVGLFHCVISSSGGNIVTRDALLRMVCAPTITGDLQDVKASLLAEGIFKVSAECEDPMTYVWQTKSANSTEWQDVSYDPKYKGQGTPTLVVAGVEEEDVGLFHCVISSDGGTVETRDASLAINWRLSCSSLHFEELSTQVAKLNSAEGHVSCSSLKEISALRNAMVGFKGPIERYQSKVSAENFERQLVKQGHLVKLSRSDKAQRYFLLFTDVLIVTEKKGSDQYLFKDTLPVHYMQVEEKSKHSDSALWFDVYSVTRSFALIAKSTEDKQQWIQELEKCIEAYNQKIGRNPLISDCIHLEHAPINEPDWNVTKCQLCAKSFTMTFRRHHCRKCGKIICDPCSRAKVKLTSHKKLVRVCDRCDPAKSSAANPHWCTVPIEPTVLERPAGAVDGLKRGRVKCGRTNSQMWYELDSDGALYVYRAQKDPSAERSIPLFGYVLMPNRGDLSLRLTHPKGDELFTVESVEEFDQWSEAIKKILP